MQVSLTGKTAIITGAASGIGLATALNYIEADARGVVAVDLSDQPPRELAPAVATGRLKYVAGDVREEETAKRFTTIALESFGRIDILVNNAGISVVKPIHEHTPA